MRKIFRSLRSDEGVRIHETITTMLATWRRRELDPPEQLQSEEVAKKMERLHDLFYDGIKRRTQFGQAEE